MVTIYHGTPEAVHLSPHSYLDPRFSTGTPGDHTHLTRIYAAQSLDFAKINAMPKPKPFISIRSKNGPSAMIFRTSPVLNHVGYVYELDDVNHGFTPDPNPEGAKTGDYVSEKLINVLQVPRIDLPTLSDLVKNEGLKIYVLSPGKMPDMISAALNEPDETSIFRCLDTLVETGLIQDLTPAILNPSQVFTQHGIPRAAPVP